MLPQYVDLYDKGYVRLVDKLGSDLTIVNSARVSYAKESKALTEGDKKLIKFLATHDHTSPFRHAMLQFEVYAPLMVTRQWWKYVVGGDHVMDAWNESSRRYVTDECEFYLPKEDEWRSAPANSKQGSGKPIDASEGKFWTAMLQATQENGVANYEEAMKAGICAEQARLFLPAYGMFVRWYWTASLQSVAHLLNQRMAHDAQFEFQTYAKAVYDLAKPHFENALPHLIKE
jgi:thymidylate synthase (FAD)